MHALFYYSAWAFERYRHSAQTPCTLRGAFEAWVYPYTLIRVYMRAPWQLWCSFKTVNTITKHSEASDLDDGILLT